METEEIVPLGIAMSPEGRQIFTGLTVAENLRMGSYTRKDKAGVERDLEWVLSLFPRLKERLNQVAGDALGRRAADAGHRPCAHGEAPAAAPGRAVAGSGAHDRRATSSPSSGRSTAEGTAVLLVEQNANLALRTADYAYILETGKLAMHGPAAELRRNPEVKRIYLGG